MPAACADLTTDLSADEARVILADYFSDVRYAYLAHGGVDAVKRTKLFVAPWVHDSPRHFAACDEDGLKIFCAPEMAELPPETIVAILGHEFGHATDFLYPGEFVLGDEGEPARRRSRDDVDDAQWERSMRAWQKRDDDVVELTADAIAHYVVGARIGYVGPCLLQCFDRGEPRPIGLR